MNPATTEKTLNTSPAPGKGARDQVFDIEVTGTPDLFKLLSKASSQNQGWMKSTKAMNAGDGVVVQVTSQQRNPDGSWALGDALAYIPGVQVIGYALDNGPTKYRLVSRPSPMVHDANEQPQEHADEWGFVWDGYRWSARTAHPAKGG